MSWAWGTTSLTMPQRGASSGALRRPPASRPPGPRGDGHPGVIVVLENVEGPAHLPVGGGMQRVHQLGAVDGDGGDVVALFDGDVSIWHGGFLVWGGVGGPR